MGVKKNKVIYGYVRCEKKICVNKYKPLKVPKILIGKQKCQICKNIMQKVRLDKNAEVIKNKKSQLRVIDYVYKNFDVKKQYKSGFLQNPLTPKNRFFTNIEASTIEKENGSKWKFDLTYNWVGKQRLPKHELSIIKSGYSPNYSLVNIRFL